MICCTLFTKDQSGAKRLNKPWDYSNARESLQSSKYNFVANYNYSKEVLFVCFDALVAIMFILKGSGLQRHWQPFHRLKNVETVLYFPSLDIIAIFKVYHSVK